MMHGTINIKFENNRLLDNGLNFQCRLKDVNVDCIRREYADATEETSTRTAAQEVGLYMHKLRQNNMVNRKG